MRVARELEDNRREGEESWKGRHVQGQDEKCLDEKEGELTTTVLFRSKIILSSPAD